jgi:hypothetical protein
MPFQKNNKLGFTPEGEKPLDRNPVCFKLDPELKQRLLTIPDWQKRLRGELPTLIQKWTAE